MNPYLTSFLLYAVPANLITVVILLFGRKRQAHWRLLEYPFSNLPWLAFLGLTLVVFGGLDQVPEFGAIRNFVLVLQSLGSGVMGGLVQAPRLVVKTDLPPLLITGLSAFIVSILYVKFRMMLFIVVEALSSTAA